MCLVGREEVVLGPPHLGRPAHFIYSLARSVFNISVEVRVHGSVAKQAVRNFSGHESPGISFLNGYEVGHGPAVHGNADVFAGLDLPQDTGDVVAQLTLRYRFHAVTVARLLRLRQEGS